jgi:hypothetical protein
MATWTLSPQYKKSAVERQYWSKDGKVIIREEGFRWATFYVESDERPLSDQELQNPDGYELGSIDNDESWELDNMTDGCWADSEAGRNCTEQDLEEFDEAWEEDSFEGVEALGWYNDETEYWYYGPLELTNSDTGQVFQGKPEQSQEKTEQQLKAELDELIATMPEVPEDDEHPPVTDWFPISVNPVRKGRYEVTDHKAPNWPFPQYANWDGNAWDHSEIVSWRGLATNPSK